jgi:nucleoside-diphosphate-sugar epimerase
VNIGNPEERSVRDLAERVIALTGSASPIVHEPLPMDDPRVRRPDITRARELLGWEPRVPLDEGLRLTIAYFRGLLEADPAGRLASATPVSEGGG